MKPGDAWVLQNVLVVVGALAALLGCFWRAALYIGIAVMFSSLIPHFLFYRCPHCGKQLGRDKVKYCPHCGERVDG